MNVENINKAIAIMKRAGKVDMSWLAWRAAINNFKDEQ